MQQGQSSSLAVAAAAAGVAGLAVLTSAALAVRLARASAAPSSRRRRGDAERHGRRRERRVLLVGAGPGSPDLVTVRGLRAVQEADFVVHDRLVAPALVAEARACAVLINVGKAPHKKRFAQTDINNILLQLATNSHPDFEVPDDALIVRLKGGDPFVFGLGGDEVLALAQAGVACEVVPGICSALAVPGCAGIPVTQKGVATSFTVLTGHVPPGEPGAADWDSLPRRGATLVVLMGTKALPKICAHLVDSAGWSPDTPVACIQSGTTADERVLRGNLASMPGLASDAGLASPSIIVVGDVCNVIDPAFIAAPPASSFAASAALPSWGTARAPL